MFKHQKQFRGAVSGSISIKQLNSDKFWLPFEFRIREEQRDNPLKTQNSIEVYWVKAEEFDLSQEFFYSSILTLNSPSRDSPLVRSSSLLTFQEYAEQIKTYNSPDYFFFHVSRCGSTLACNLAKSVGYAALSEPQPLDFILRIRSLMNVELPFGDDRFLHMWLKVWGEYFAAKGQKYVVKPDCWLNFNIDTILRVSPTSEALFLWRDFSEVIASQLRITGMAMIPELVSPQWLGLQTPQNHMIPDGYMFDVIAALFKAGITLTPEPKKSTIRYNDLISRLFQIFGHLNYDAFNNTAKIDAKHTGIEFKDKTAKNLELISPEKLQNIKLKQAKLMDELGLSIDIGS